MAWVERQRLFMHVSPELMQRVLMQRLLVRQILRIGAGCVLLVGVQGCRLGPRSIASLDQIRTYPTTVRVAGTVGDRVPLVEQHLYELQDDSGVIWVLSSADPLPPGTRIRLQATVQAQTVPILPTGPTPSPDSPLSEALG